VPARPKASAKVDAKAKRAAVAAIWIRERDGVKIFKEVADQLLDRQPPPDVRQWKTRPTESSGLDGGFTPPPDAPDDVAARWRW
jgi:hypothetical protein